jgi:cytochrome c-type biogenesis protein CcsB
MKIAFLILTLILSTNLFADNYFCKKELESLPIQQNGRVKPLYVHASEMIKMLTGKSHVNDMSAVEAYCLLSINGLGMKTDITLSARIDHVDLMKFLGLAKDQHTMAFEELITRFDSLKNEARTIKDNQSYRTAISNLMNAINTYQEIKVGENWMLAEKTGSANEVSWIPLTAYLTEAKVVAQKSLTPDDPFLPVILQSKDHYVSLKGDKYIVELYYAKAQLANWSLLITIIALASLVLFQNFNIALGFTLLSLIAQIVLVSLRVIISGRAPITNMYETVLVSGLGSLLLALLLGHFKKEKIFIYMGLGYNLCTLMMITFANGMLTATISPLVPVLRDNFWLSTHVTTIMLSYGALALSWVMANGALFKRKFRTLDRQEELRLGEVLYTTLKYGTTMLAAGIILGGVWADYSWGRFWGWDPKETWSLIVLCIYMAILHGRYTNWIKTDRFIAITAGAFMSVMMAWFGVNYILATGLHSYGFSEGGAVFLGSFFLLQTTFLVITRTKKSL